MESLEVCIIKDKYKTDFFKINKKAKIVTKKALGMVHDGPLYMVHGI